MKIYRIEDSTGKGAYTTKRWTETKVQLWKKLFGYDPHTKTPNHPGPYDDHGLIRGRDYVRLTKNSRFGFLDKSQLLTWFTREELMFLFSTLRLRLRRIEVPAENVKIGHYQVVYTSK